MITEDAVSTFRLEEQILPIGTFSTHIQYLKYTYREKRTKMN